MTPLNPEVAAGCKGEKVAIDTGVWLEGLLFGGAAEELVKLAIAGRLRLFTASSLLDDLMLVLGRDFGFSKAAINHVRRFVHECSVVYDDGNVARDDSSRETRQARVVRVAQASGADSIVTSRREDVMGGGFDCAIPVVRLA